MSALNPSHSYSGPGADTSSTGSSQQGAPVGPSTFVMTNGWYVAIACVTGVMVANTKFGPFAFGILTVALIFQTNLLLQGK
jgi:hypothetical protein